MCTDVLSLEQLQIKKAEIISKIEDYKLQKIIFFQNKGIESILKRGSDIVKQGFTAEAANEVLQVICREVFKELSRIDTELTAVEKKLLSINKSIGEFK